MRDVQHAEILHYLGFFARSRFKYRPTSSLPSRVSLVQEACEGPGKTSILSTGFHWPSRSPVCFFPLEQCLP